MATGTFLTQEFDTYADTQVEGALGSKKKYVIVLADETAGDAWSFYFFDGDILHSIYSTPDGGSNPFVPSKDYITANGGETELAENAIHTAALSMVWQGVTPLIEYSGTDAVPGGQYKIDVNKILLGDPAGAGEIFTIIKFG